MDHFIKDYSIDITIRKINEILKLLDTFLLENQANFDLLDIFLEFTKLLTKFKIIYKIIKKIYIEKINLNLLKKDKIITYISENLKNEFLSKNSKLNLNWEFFLNLDFFINEDILVKIKNNLKKLNKSEILNIKYTVI